MADAPGYIDVQAIQKANRNKSPKGAVVTPGKKTEYLNNTPATNNAVRANAFPQNFGERTKDAAVGSDLTKGDGGF